MSTQNVNDHLKECIADAILILLKDKPIDKITVDDIFKKAGVGRATYFRSFNNKIEPITFKFVKMWEQYCEMNSIEVTDRFDLNNALPFFEYNYSIKHILEIVYKAGLQEAVHESFYQIMYESIQDDYQSGYRESFYAHGLYGLLDAWVRRDFKESPAEMAEIIKKIVTIPYINTLDNA